MTRTQARPVADKQAPAAVPAAEPRPAAREDGPEMLGSGNLDPVREILFGAQSRGLEKRLARLEEEVPKRLAEIREELRRGVANLEAYARAEIDSLNDRLRAEGRERETAGQEAGARLEEMVKGLRREAAQLEERSTGAQREIRQQLLDQGKRLDEEIQRRSEELVAALTRAVDELRSEKADRKIVASILHEVAMRLNDELSLPFPEGARS